MTIDRDRIEGEIRWYNKNLESVKTKLKMWLEELGHNVSISEKEATNNEEPSGLYKTKQFQFIIDSNLKISLIPYGIWLIGTKGRIDISGPSGSEKLIFLSKGGSGMISEVKKETDLAIEKSSHKYFKNVDIEDWYWYDDSSYRVLSRFTKDIVEPLLERLQ